MRNVLYGEPDKHTGALMPTAILDLLQLITTAIRWAHPGAADRRRRPGLWVMFAALALASSVAPASEQPGARAARAPTFAFYYGANPPVAELSSFDAVAVEPTSGFDPRQAQTPNTAWFAYVSVGEVLASAAYFKDIPKDWLVASNSAWNSAVVNQTATGWPQFYVNHVIAPLWDKGYRGFFLDTLDSYQLYAKTDADRASAQAGLVAVVKAIKHRYPRARLIFNRGFEILPQVHEQVYAVAFESLFQGWNQADKRYAEVPQADRDWLMTQVKMVNGYGLPAIAIDYCAPGDRGCARATATKIKALGVIPYITDPLLSTVGLGSIEVMPRSVLVLQDGLPAARLEASAGLQASDGRHSLPAALGYLGYRSEFADIAQPLPDDVSHDRYAGIVVRMNSDAPRPDALRAWITQATDAGVPIAMLDGSTVPPVASLQQALHLPSMPVPDTTTENGRRLMTMRVDGDGFTSKAAFKDAWGSVYSGDVLYRVIKKYGFPTTVSVVDNASSDEDPLKTSAPALRATAKKIFALPNVEMAGHSSSSASSTTANGNGTLTTPSGHEPLSGLDSALVTFQRTGQPVRFEPVDVHYSMLAGIQYASVQTLDTMYDALSRQLLNPVFSSEYAAKAIDFDRMAIARDGSTWQVRDAGYLRTVRLAPGQAPELADSVGVAGYAPGPGGVYVNLTGTQARFSVIETHAGVPDSNSHIAYLQQANGSIDDFMRRPDGLSFDLHTYMAPNFTLANARACRVSANGRTLDPLAPKAEAGVTTGGTPGVTMGVTTYALERVMANRSKPLQVTRIDVECAG
jgi:hypothetical protein